MKKYLFIAAAAVAMLASCSQSDDLSAPVTQQNTEDNAVQFGTYVGKGASSRANEGGIPGSITQTTLETGAHSTAGFGVFGFQHTSAWTNDATNTGSNKPNFLYNEQIKYNSTSTKWEYAIPANTKYWPNGIDAGNTSGDPSKTATSDNVDKLSFFAYAPYVVNVPSTGVVTSSTDGITAITQNSTVGDRWISYTMKTPKSDAAVDLLWGLAGNTTYNEADNDDPSLTKGSSYNVDLTKQEKDETVDFFFKHALARVGGSKTAETKATGLKVVLDIDGNSTGTTGTGTKANQTLVTIESINIKNVNDGSNKSLLATSGQFDIMTGTWKGWTIPDNTTDGQLDLTYGTSELNSALLENFTTSAKLSWDGSGTTWKRGDDAFTGVTHGTAQDVFASSTDAPAIYILPQNAGQKLKIAVKYIVRTYDDKLAATTAETADTYTGGTWTKAVQTVTNEITLPALDPNKHYTIVMHLGLTSIKFTAEVADWSDETGTGDPGDEIDKDIYLPSNVVE